MLPTANLGLLPLGLKPLQLSSFTLGYQVVCEKWETEEAVVFFLARLSASLLLLGMIHARFPLVSLDISFVIFSLPTANYFYRSKF